eukprot:888407-Rhodomonas_salina.2
MPSEMISVCCAWWLSHSAPASFSCISSASSRRTLLAQSSHVDVLLGEQTGVRRLGGQVCTARLSTITAEPHVNGVVEESALAARAHKCQSVAAHIPLGILLKTPCQILVGEVSEATSQRPPFRTHLAATSCLPTVPTVNSTGCRSPPTPISAENLVHRAALSLALTEAVRQIYPRVKIEAIQSVGPRDVGASHALE